MLLVSFSVVGPLGRTPRAVTADHGYGEATLVEALIAQRIESLRDTTLATRPRRYGWLPQFRRLAAPASRL